MICDEQSAYSYYVHIIIMYTYTRYTYVYIKLNLLTCMHLMHLGVYNIDHSMCVCSIRYVCI